MPVGVKYSFNAGSWTLSPTIEYDYLINSRETIHLGEVGQENVALNTRSGYGLRAEFMAGKNSWSFGPFIRYFSFDNSNAVTNSSNTYENAKNNDIEAGAAIRYSY